jgi:hypothetical protein
LRFLRSGLLALIFLQQSHKLCEHFDMFAVSSKSKTRAKATPIVHLLCSSREKRRAQKVYTHFVSHGYCFQQCTSSAHGSAFESLKFDGSCAAMCLPVSNFESLLPSLCLLAKKKYFTGMVKWKKTIPPQTPDKKKLNLVVERVLLKLKRPAPTSSTLFTKH